MRERMRFQLQGFSLLELSVSVVLLTLLCILLFHVINAATRTWMWNQSGAQSFCEGRAALGVISRELQSVFVHGATDRLPGVVIARVADDGKLAGPVSVAEDGTGNALFFLAAVPLATGDSGETDDLCALGYFPAFNSDPVPGRRCSRKLYRYFSGGAPTFETVRRALASPRSGGRLSLERWPEAATRLFVPDPEAGDPEGFSSEIVARNVAGFSVKALTTGNRRHPLGPKAAGDPWRRTDWPDALELKITVLNEAAAMQISRETWDEASRPVEQWSSAFRRNARTFHARVGLPVSALDSPDGDAPQVVIR